MRDYAKFVATFWTGETGKKFRGDPRLQVMAVYLFTCPNSNMLGLYYLPLPTIAHELGWTTEGASKALRRVSEGGFAHFDPISECVWVPEMARFQVGDNLSEKDNRCRGVQREYESLPKNPFLGDFFDKYKDIFHLSKRRDSTSPFEAPCKPLRSQEQEQEQEQDKTHTSLDSDCLIVWSAWKQAHPAARDRPGRSALKAIKAALRDGYSVEICCKACVGIHKDPWEGRVDYLDIEHAIALDAIERFARYADEDPAKLRRETPEQERNRKHDEWCREQTERQLSSHG